MKKALVILLLSLFLISFVSAVVSAQETTKVESKLCTFLNWKQDNWFCKRMAMWEPGFDFANASKADLNGFAILFKYIMLFLIIILVYSGLDYAKFPQSGMLRFIIALILGFLLTFVVSTAEILTAMTSYSALGVTLIVFFPIMILGFFTVLVASKANPIGIFIQRIMWIIYAVFLFLKAGALALGKWYIQTHPGYNPAQPGNGAFEQIIFFLIGDPSKYNAEFVSNAVLIVLIIVAIAVFVLMVWKDHAIIAWLAKEKREAEIEGKKAELERSKAYTKLTSQQMENQ